MRARWLAGASVAVFAVLPAAEAARSQDAPKRVLVVDFDQSQVQGGLREVFGRDNVNVGRSIARLVGARLAAAGFQVVESSGSIPFTLDPSASAAAGRSAGADAVVAGSLVTYGSASGMAGGGPRIGGIRLNVGRRTTVVAVALESRVIDVASGTLLGVVPANAQGSRSGLAVTVEVPNIVDASGLIDMTRDDFRRTAIGEFTEQAVGQLVTGVADMRGRIGAVAAAPAAPAPAPMAAAVPSAAPLPGGPIVYPSGPFMYAPFQFRGTEHFRYDVTQVESGRTVTGFYQFDLQPAGAGQVRMSVQGQVGTDSWSSSVTVGTGGQAGPQMMMSFAPLMTMGPLAITLFNPTSWIIFGGHQLSVGDGWSTTSEGESTSVRVEQQCAHAGQGGLLIVLRRNNQVVSESCVSPTVAMPLRVLTADEGGDRVELTLTEYRP